MGAPDTPAVADDSTPPMHTNEIALSIDQVKRIVEEQFPEWRGLEVTPVAGSGTVNRIFRLGERPSARFPLVVDDPEERLEYLEIEADAAREPTYNRSGRTRTLAC
jgi:aminoglycoside phosphotransferase (APT) family kinase protein